MCDLCNPKWAVEQEIAEKLLYDDHGNEQLSFTKELDLGKAELQKKT